MIEKSRAAFVGLSMSLYLHNHCIYYTSFILREKWLCNNAVVKNFWIFKSCSLPVSTDSTAFSKFFETEFYHIVVNEHQLSQNLRERNSKNYCALTEVQEQRWWEDTEMKRRSHIYEKRTFSHELYTC